MPFRILAAWFRWHNHWDELCTCCGKCCYRRRVADNGEVIIDYEHPCEFLDTETNLCTVYKERFKRCSYCGKVNLWTALFNPTLPPDCPYVTNFRLWKKQNNPSK